MPSLGAKPFVVMLAGVEGLPYAEGCVSLLKMIGHFDVTPEEEPDPYFRLGKRHYSDLREAHMSHPHLDRQNDLSLLPFDKGKGSLF